MAFTEGDLARRTAGEDPRRDYQLAAEARAIMATNRRLLEEQKAAHLAWRAGFEPVEQALIDQGLLVFMGSLGPQTVRITGPNGDMRRITVEGVKYREGTVLFIPSTQEAQRTHGEILEVPKSSAV